MSLFLALTARHTMGVEALWRSAMRVEERINDWGEVVTRYPYGNVGMDHLQLEYKITN
jgi:hypothetical protein